MSRSWRWKRYLLQHRLMRLNRELLKLQAQRRYIDNMLPIVSQELTIVADRLAAMGNNPLNWREIN